MNILEYADALNMDLEIRYYPNQDGRFCAQIERAEVKEGSMLAGVSGNGGTPAAAVENYLQKIRGKRLVINAYRETRQEYDVPNSLTGLP